MSSLALSFPVLFSLQIANFQGVTQPPSKAIQGSVDRLASQSEFKIKNSHYEKNIPWQWATIKNTFLALSDKLLVLWPRTL